LVIAQKPKSSYASGRGNALLAHRREGTDIPRSHTVKKFWIMVWGTAACAAALAQGPTGAGTATSALVIVVGSPAGTPGDVVARAISGPLASELGQPVVVENRPGAIGTVAIGAVARSRPDSPMLGVFGLQAAVAPSLLKSVSYDSAKDLAPVRQLSSVSNVLVVRAEHPAGSLDELVKAARAGTVTYGSGGNGTPAHLAGELFKQNLGLNLQHVPFNGAVAGVTAVLGGHVEMMFATTPSVVALVKSGKLRALATTSPQRIPALPEVPTLAELGHPGVSVRDWHGLVAPAGISRAAVERLSAAVGKVLAMEGVQQRLAGAGLDTVTVSGPAEFGGFMTEEMARWSAVIGKGGITAQ
jgi:tripartite-type tricarboxylate transporter receptor subunit TctC